MSIRWRNVKVTDKHGEGFLNFQARQFIEEKCPDVISNIERTKWADIVRVKISAEKTSLELKDIKGVLSKALGKIGARLTILEDRPEPRVTVPVTRRNRNVVKIKETKLIIQFVYNRDPKGLSPLAFLEDSKVKVTAVRDGETLTETTDKGIADFGAVKPGKYTITADYPETDECKYDWIDKKRDVQVKPGSEELVEFQVEPLYQKVEFIAHCLLTIPNQIYVLLDEDKDKAEIKTGSDGKKTFAFKTRNVESGTWSWKLVTEKDTEISNKAKFRSFPRPLLLTLQKPWTLSDIEKSIADKMNFVRQHSSDPESYVVEFKPKLETKEYRLQDLTSQWKAEYHGFVKDIEDIDARVKLVKYALEKAHAQSKKEPTVLKVFMIPECFFQGLYGAYIADDATKLVEKLQQLVKDEKWQDWVFSFGTVNRVFQGIQPKGVTTKAPIYEMANHAPVIRGGLGDYESSGDDSTRLIQKLVNSAELADEDSLIKNPAAEKIRPQAVNEKVQFEATENDEKVAKLLETLLAANIPDSMGLPEKLWDDLKTELKAIIGELGIARVVRQIRTSINDDVNARGVEDWIYSAKDPNQPVIEVLYRSKKTCLPTLEQAALLVLKTQWKKSYSAPEFAKTEWADDSGKRGIVIEKVLSDLENVAKECGFRLPYQQKEIKEKIQALKINDTVAKNFVPESLNLSFEPSILPIWRKLLELYAVRVNQTVTFDVGQGSMNFEDYCFAAPRKPGAWFANLDEAKGKKACKRIVFGLEICADHTSKRLFALNQNSKESNAPVIGIDIHLVPSAGMTPMYVATRAGGYVFNCDGWNKAHAEGGKKIEVHLDGPSPFVDPLTNGTVTPVTPHSALAKRTDAVKLEIGERLTPTHEKLNTKLSDVIFGYGAGELHFYPLQDLPK